MRVRWRKSHTNKKYFLLFQKKMNMVLTEEDWRIIREKYTPGMSELIPITAHRVVVITISFIEDKKTALARLEAEKKAAKS